MGIETLANASRGSLFNITVSADNAFERIESELSGYYILGVESVPRDKDGKPHPDSRRRSKRPGVTMRSRRQVMTAGDLDHPRNPREAVMSALASPMMMSALPLTVATFPLQGPDPAKIQLLLHAAVGSDYSVLEGRHVRLHDHRRARAHRRKPGRRRAAAPVMNGVPSPCSTTSHPACRPGEYTLKLAMAEGERVGTIEHTIHAWLTEAPPVRLERADGRRTDRTCANCSARPSDTSSRSAASTATSRRTVRRRARIKATYEVAADPTSPALDQRRSAPAARPAADRIIFSKAMLVRQLPPGKYVLRAVLTVGGRPGQDRHA